MSAFTAIVLAAGRGTRMRSRIPKALHPVCGRPMVLWPVLAAKEAGAGSVVVVDCPGRPLEGVMPEGVEVVVQERPTGTGGAVAAAAPHIDPGLPVVVLSGDVPLIGSDAIAGVVEAHLREAASATLTTAILDEPAGYGRIVRADDGSLLKVVETKGDGDATAEELSIAEVNTGIYVFAGRALLAVLPRLTADNAQGELYLPQALEILRGDGEKVAVHVADDHTLLLGVNDRVALSAVSATAQQAILERHMLAGVTIVDPSRTSIDADVQIGQDTVIEPGTELRGLTSIGQQAIVGPHTVALNTAIGDRATVRASWLDGAEIGPEATVGPFAYLRPGAVVGEQAKAGTFVEIKGSTIGKGAKVPHLSYIGDADIGEGTNLGAGTITANYDGKAKHRTKIGRGVRGGVDTSFVAPVEVGDGAYTAAGSVITKYVPPGSLAIARSRQVNREGWATPSPADCDSAGRKGEGDGDQRG